jgi:hypothetical protein
MEDLTDSYKECQMKRKFILFFTVLAGLMLTACRTSVNTPGIGLDRSMKGFELYSWQNGSQWNFSLLVGTNREKSLDEIKFPDTLLSGIDPLRARLQKIAPGQYVTWSSKETLAFPPEDMIKQVEQICKDQGLILQIAR